MLRPIRLTSLLPAEDVAIPLLKGSSRLGNPSPTRNELSVIRILHLILLLLLTGVGSAFGRPADAASFPEALWVNTQLAQQVPQDSPARQTIETRILPRIQLPPGFQIEVFALAPNARHLAVSPQGRVWIGTRRTDVWEAVDTDQDGQAEQVTRFAPGIRFDVPNGPCLSPEGDLYLAERNRVLWFPNADEVSGNPEARAVPLVAQGELIPRQEESSGHTARVCVVGPDNRLYISLGQPYNVAPPSKYPFYDQVGIGGIIRINRFPGEPLNREVVAIGIRNSVGHAFNPKDGSLWFTDNQVDGMGDETPPGELNRAPRLGPDVWYGHPHYGGGEVRTYEYQNQPIPAEKARNYVAPQVEMQAHAADLGMMFYTGTQFPQKYDNAIFSAQHGSWNATTPRGAQVMVTFLNASGNAARTEVFASGWMTESGAYLGRPVDVQLYADGSLLVSDDRAGVVYRIFYQP